MILWMENSGEHRIFEYFRCLILLLERIGMHPRIDRDPDWVGMLRRAGWRPFILERYLR
jgi:hypothetical protein